MEGGREGERGGGTGVQIESHTPPCSCEGKEGKFS